MLIISKINSNLYINILSSCSKLKKPIYYCFYILISLFNINNIQASNLEELPLEAKKLIFYYSKNDDLINIAHASKSIYEIIAELKSKSIFIPKSLNITYEDFQVISKSRGLIKNVKVQGYQLFPHYMDNLYLTKNIILLDLANNNINKQLLKILCKNIKKNFSIKHINLALNNIKDKDVKYLVDCFTVNKVVKHLILKYNLISSKGVKGLNKIIYSNVLKHLDLGFNKISSKGYNKLLKAILNNCSIKSIYLDGIEITEAGTKTLAKIINTHPSLKTLSLNKKKVEGYLYWHLYCIKDQEIKQISDALITNKTLERIDLENHAIYDLGAQYLSYSLKINNNIRSLNIGYNQISDIGFKYLLDMVLINNSLKELSIFGNNFTEKTINYIKEILLRKYILIKYEI